MNIYTQVNNNNTGEQSDAEATASRQELILELQRQIQSKEDLKKAYEQSYAEFQQELIGAKVSGTHASDHGQAYAGFVGEGSQDFKGRLDVSDTTATSHGFAAAGVVYGVQFPKN